MFENQEVHHNDVVSLWWARYLNIALKIFIMVVYSENDADRLRQRRVSNHTTEYSENKYLFAGEIAKNPQNNRLYLKKVNSINVRYNQNQIPVFRKKPEEHPNKLYLNFSDEWLILEYLNQLENENISLTPPITTNKQVLENYLSDRWNSGRYETAINFLLKIDALKEIEDSSLKINEKLKKIINYTEEDMFGKQLINFENCYHHRMLEYIQIENPEEGIHCVPMHIVNQKKENTPNKFLFRQIAIPSASILLEGIEAYKNYALSKITSKSEPNTNNILIEAIMPC